MTQNGLTHLPDDLLALIAGRLDHRDQFSLLQTCKPLRDATQQVRRSELARQSEKPERISTDPFPTLYEHVQRGGTVHYRAMHLENLLRACAPLPPGDGKLQGAARRVLHAMPRIERTSKIWGNNQISGEMDRQGRPHGVALCFSTDPTEWRSIYLGDWEHGQRCGYGTQFFWNTVPALAALPSVDGVIDCAGLRLTLPCKPLQGGWYEGEWSADQYSGRGLMRYADQTHWEGRWNNGRPVGDET